MTKQQENNLDKKSGIKNLDFFISIHDLRHSHTSMLVHLGENPKMIQERFRARKYRNDVRKIFSFIPKTRCRACEKIRSNKLVIIYP